MRYHDHGRRDFLKGFAATAALAAEAADAYGIKVGIHTTYHHFTTVYGGRTAWDVMYSEASPKLYQQVDTANTIESGRRDIVVCD